MGDYLQEDEVVRVELDVDVVLGVLLVTIESVLLGPLKKVLRKLPRGFPCRSHNTVARGARVGCSGIIVNSGLVRNTRIEPRRECVLMFLESDCLWMTRRWMFREKEGTVVDGEQTRVVVTMALKRTVLHCRLRSKVGST